MTVNFLTEVLGQSQRIHELISQSTRQLSAIASLAEHESPPSERPQGSDLVLDTTANVRTLLQQASNSLNAVNHTLQVAIRDQRLVDFRLAAALEQEEGARKAALHDNLTGLANRVLFNDRLEHGIAQAKRHRWLLAVMFVDLDNFKAINDTYGHQTGDAVLKAVASRLGHNVRNDDTVSRYGGDEFLYLLASLHEQKDIAMIATKILKAVQMPCDVTIGNETVHLALGASIGISMFPHNGSTADELIRRADEAMYAAKQTGSSFVFAT